MTTFPLKLGSQGQEVTDLDRAAVKRYSKIALEKDLVTPLKPDGYFGSGEAQFATAWQHNMKRSVTGQISLEEFNHIVHGTPFPTPGVAVRQGWVIFTMPGSGADWTVGPSFQVGWYAEQVHGIRHQGVQFAQGGYMGFMGGDAKLSYVASNLDMQVSLAFLLRTAPEVAFIRGQLATGMPRVEVKGKLLFSGYSKSADGLEDALVVLFGDGGEFADLRDFIGVVLNFGNPSRRKGAKSGVPGWNPPGWGIARKIRPAWLDRVVVSITNPGDFYAVVPDSDDIRPPFYAEIVTSSAQLGYFVHVMNIAIQVALGYVPLVGSIIKGPLGGNFLGGLAGLSGQGINLLSGVLGQTDDANHDTDVDAKLIALFQIQGLITHLDDLVGLVMALPGLQNHGMYESPFPELGNRSGADVGKLHVDLLVQNKLVLV